MSSRENFDQTVMLLACLFRNILRPLAFANLRPAYAGGRWVRIALRSGSCGSIARAAHMPARPAGSVTRRRSEEHTSELQSLMRISYAVFCLKKKKNNNHQPMQPAYCNVSQREQY